MCLLQSPEQNKFFVFVSFVAESASNFSSKIIPGLSSLGLNKTCFFSLEGGGLLRMLTVMKRGMTNLNGFTVD